MGLCTKPCKTTRSASISPNPLFIKHNSSRSTAPHAATTFIFSKANMLVMSFAEDVRSADPLDSRHLVRSISPFPTRCDAALSRSGLHCSPGIMVAQYNMHHNLKQCGTQCSSALTERTGIRDLCGVERERDVPCPGALEIRSLTQLRHQQQDHIPIGILTNKPGNHLD